MAIISFLLSFIGKKIGSILQAIFGWSVTALFGRLSPKRQLAVTGALILSIAWPFFVLGVFLPGVASWALAILPLEKWVGATVLRIVWSALAVLAAPLVGILVHFAAPHKKGGILRSAINGYPLAVGFFVAFVVTVVTVPIVKLASILKGWSDTHVYIQPREGRYNAVLRELAEACARSGAVPEIVEPAKRMTIATTVLRSLAKGAVSPIVAEEVKVVRSHDVEMTLYPADLLLRGDPERVAKVRAMMARTDLDADAYLVASECGQHVQDELGRLTEVVRQHEAEGRDVGRMATTRLVEIWRELNRSELPYDEWVMLEAIARRLERRLVTRHMGGETMPLDRDEDALTDIAAKANEFDDERTEETPMVTQKVKIERTPVDEPSTAELIREVLEEAKELVRIEVAIAKVEAKREINDAKQAAIALGIAVGVGLLLLATLTMALVFALGGTALAALAVAAGLFVVGGVAAWLGYAKLPKKPLERTRGRIQTDVARLKEHVA